jgi:hypothetical protein
MKVTKLYEKGLTNLVAISKETSIGERTVRRHITRWKSRTPVKDIKRQGRLAKIAPTIHTFIGSELHRNPLLSSREIAASLSQKKHVDVVPITV